MNKDNQNQKDENQDDPFNDIEFDERFCTIQEAINFLKKNPNNEKREKKYEILWDDNNGNNNVDVDMYALNQLNNEVDNNNYIKIFFRNNINIISNNFNNELYLSNFFYFKNLYLNNLIFDKIQFEYPFFMNLKVENCHKGKLNLILRVNKNDDKEKTPLDSQLDNTKCRNIEIKKSSLNNLRIHSNDGYINSIKLENINIESNNEYFFSNFNCKEFIIRKLNNFSENFLFLNCSLGTDTSDNRFRIISSNLGNITFMGVNFGKCEFENINLINAIFSNVIFYNYNFSISDEKEKNKKNLIDNNEILKDVYRQFKIVMDKNGNYTEANNFYGKEMEYYMKYLRNKKPFKSFLYYGLLRTEKRISNFGNNFGLTLIYIFLLPIIYIIGLLIYSLLFYNIDFSFSKLYFELLDPTFGFFDKDSIRDKGRFIVFGFISYKILYGFLIYHFIVSLRRYSKR